MTGAAPSRAAAELSDPGRPLLSVRQLTVGFRSSGAWRDVVQDLSFDLALKQTLAVVGESGSGKSVTALSIMRLLPPVYSRYSGDISFDGRNLLSCSADEMRAVRGNRIAMIFQEPMTSLNPVFTVGFQIGEALKYHRGMVGEAARRRAIELLERVRIPNAAERFDSFPHTLSGGMRQRVMIAMALACEPKLLIADEPTTALDVTVQQQILDLIKTLQNEMGMSVLFITHDMGVVADIADRVLVMRNGVKQEEGTASDLFLKPQSTYARALLAAVPRLGSMRGAAQPLKAAEIARAAPGQAPQTPSAETPILAVENLDHAVRGRQGVVRPWRPRRPCRGKCLLHAEARRDLGACRRKRLRKIDDRPQHRPAGRADKRRGAFPGRGCAGGARAESAARAPGHPDDLSGSLRLAQSA